MTVDAFTAALYIADLNVRSMTQSATILCGIHYIFWEGACGKVSLEIYGHGCVILYFIQLNGAS